MQSVAEGICVLDSHFLSWGCKGSVRMTILQGETGLILYSPVALDADALRAIHALGDVEIIIAPNLFHHLYLRACSDLFPAAAVFVPDGLIEKIGPVARAYPIGALRLGASLSALTVKGHILNETVLFHHATGTLVTADLIYNFQAEHYTAEKLFFRSIGCYGKPSVAFYHRFAITSKAELRQSIEAILAWPVRRIIMSHGRIIEGVACGEIFASAWKALV